MELTRQLDESRKIIAGFGNAREDKLAREGIGLLDSRRTRVLGERAPKTLHQRSGSTSYIIRGGKNIKKPSPKTREKPVAFLLAREHHLLRLKSRLNCIQGPHISAFIKHDQPWATSLQTDYWAKINDTQQSQGQRCSSQAVVKIPVASFQCQPAWPERTGQGTDEVSPRENPPPSSNKTTSINICKDF